MDYQELIELKNTLKADGYKDWCYSQLTIDKAISTIKNTHPSSTSSIIKFGAYLTGHDTETIEQMYNDWEKQINNL